MPPIDKPDTSKTERGYWNEVLDSYDLSMSRGREVDMPIDDQVYAEAEQRVQELQVEARKAKNKGGRPKKARRSKRNRVFEHYSPIQITTHGCKDHAWQGRGLRLTKNVRKFETLAKDWHMLVYIGDNGALARLEATQLRQESGICKPPGFGPER